MIQSWIWTRRIENERVFEFCRKRIDLLIFNISIVAVVYGCRIFNLSVTMDTDLFINTPRSVYNWLDIGRYGLIFTEKFLEYVGIILI